MTASTGPVAGGGYVFHEGDRIRKAREQAEMTQQELADLATISRATLSSYEGGGRVKQSSRRLLALALGVTVEWLRDGVLAHDSLPGEAPVAQRIELPPSKRKVATVSWLRKVS